MAITVLELIPERMKNGVFTADDLHPIEISGDDEAKILAEMAAYTIIKSKRETLSHEDMGDYDAGVTVTETPLLDVPGECIVCEGRLIGVLHNNMIFFTDGREPIGDGVCGVGSYENGRSTYHFRTNYSLRKDVGVSVYQGVLYRANGDNPYHTAHYAPSSIKTIRLHPDTEEIEKGAFEDHPALESIFITDKVKKIGWFAFRGCTALKEVRLPASIDSITLELFRGCSALESIEIPEGVVRIGDDAFKDCISLRTVKIPKTVKHLDARNFSGCRNLLEIIAETPPMLSFAVDWGVNIHSGESLVTMDNDFVFYLGKEQPMLVAYHGSDEAVTLPKDYKGEKYIFGKYIFQNSKITSLTVPEGVTELSEFAFSLSDMLERVVLPVGITEIPICAFSGCTKLESVALPEGLITIGDRAFSHCERLTSLTVPDSVTVIGDSAFSNCIRLSEVKLGAGLQKLDAACFFHCHELRSIIIPEGVRVIGGSAFRGCHELSEITLPSTITEIGWCAFEACMALTELPEGIQYLPQYAFYNCIRLLTADIPEGVTEIGYGAFRDCEKLRRVTVPASVSLIKQEVFKNCDALSEVHFVDPKGWPTELSDPHKAAIYLRENIYDSVEKKK